MSVLIVIPARLESSRLPRKALLDLGGKPVIQHVWELANEVDGVDEVIVATDHNDIVEAVRRGIDMFDCVLPTRSGRTGQAFTLGGPINIRNARFADDPSPLDENSDCPASRDYSRAYLHHLFKGKEMLGSTLLSWHNVSFYQRLMADLRAAIDQGRLEAFSSAFLGEYRTDEGACS